MENQNVLLLGEITQPISIRTAIYVADKHDNKYLVLQLINDKVIFVQSYTLLFKALMDIYSVDRLEGHSIHINTTMNGKKYLAVD